MSPLSSFPTRRVNESIFMPPYEDYVKQFKTVAVELLALTSTARSVKDLPKEEAELKFVRIFRELMRLGNNLESFSEYEDEDLALPSQRFTDYQSAYLDLYDKVKTDNDKESESVLSEVDFELELMYRDIINVQYIFTLLAQLYEADAPEQVRIRILILDSVAGEINLRNEGDLI